MIKKRKKPRKYRCLSRFDCWVFIVLWLVIGFVLSMGWKCYEINDLLTNVRFAQIANWQNEVTIYKPLFIKSRERQQHIIRAANLLRHWHRTEALKELNTAP